MTMLSGQMTAARAWHRQWPLLLAALTDYSLIALFRLAPCQAFAPVQEADSGGVAPTGPAA